MKILVATGLTQGTAPNDYNHCVEGELVWPQEPCPKDRDNPDGPCGCARGFVGTATHRATTTAMVVESEMSRGDVVLAFTSSLADHGWPADAAAELADDNLIIAAQIPVGCIITHDRDQFYMRGALLR